CKTSSLAAISQIPQVFIKEEMCLNSFMTWKTTKGQWSFDIESVAVDVGRGESDYDFIRSITRVVIGGTDEVS
ncbi:hypothetical protein Tco_0476565, partial [Tanacetum coccineum]